jgi:hypothetical protein
MKRSLTPLILLSVLASIWAMWVLNDFMDNIVNFTNIHGSLKIFDKWAISVQLVLKSTVLLVAIIIALCNRYVKLFYIQMKDIIVSFLWFRLGNVLLLMLYIILSLIFYCIFLTFIDTFLFHLTCIFYEK